MPRKRSHYGGSRIRDLRLSVSINQADMARRLGVSVSYLSQIENGDRPVTPAVHAALAASFPDRWASIDDDADATLVVETLEAACDPSVEASLPADIARRAVPRQPQLARRMVALHAAYRRSLEQLRVLDDRVDSGLTAAQLPWERVRDWFHAERNYVHELDRAAEEIAEDGACGPVAPALERLLLDRYAIRVETRLGTGGILRSFDPASGLLTLDATQTGETQSFQIAYQFAKLAFAEEIERISAPLGVARELLATGLTNYAAAALLMPYGRFRDAARSMRHDMDRVRRAFGTSFEQCCHRLSTLQRPGLSGTPFFFCRVDMAGNITKRHSATTLQFARFGGACPLWIVHEAVAIPDRILVQLAETPDGTRYVSMAKGLVKPSASFDRPPRRYAVAIGCEARFAASFVYADGLSLGAPATPIGPSCRICPRADCDQRAYPPAASRIELDPDQRGAVPYSFR